jgi:hypothetical protein
MEKEMRGSSPHREAGTTVLAQCFSCPGQEDCPAWQEAEAAAARGEKVKVTLGACPDFEG